VGYSGFDVTSPAPCPPPAAPPRSGPEVGAPEEALEAEEPLPDWLVVAMSWLAFYLVLGYFLTLGQPG
jgi:hypothetical protein